MNKNNKTNASYKTNKTYRTYRTYLVLFVLLFSFFIAPAKPARAAALSRPPTNLGLVGYWPMNEGVGAKAGDFSGNGNTGTITGASWVDGKKGKALSFDGVSGYISLPQSSTISPSSQVTVALWMNLQKVPVEAYELLSKSSGYVGYAYVTGATNATLNFGKYTGGVFHHLCEYTSCPALSYNSWHHVVYVYQSGFTGIYIDGILSASTTSMTGSIDVNSNPIMFNSRQLHKGSFDDVRIYNRALSATEVTKLYQSGAVKQKTVSNLGLVGYWPMNEGRGTKAGDSSGNGYTQTLSSGASWAVGKRSGAINFSGVGSSLSAASVPIASNGTYSFWLKPDSTMVPPSGTYPNLLGWIDPGMYIQNGTGRPYIQTAAGTLVANTSLIANNWQFITATWVVNGANTDFKIYRNGVLDGSLSGSSGLIAPGSATFYIGLNYYVGLMDDVRIYNRALSAGEIQNLYKQGSATIGTSYENRLTNGLVGFWTMNGKDYNSASTTAEVLDKSGNNNNGDNSGATPAIGKLGQALKFNGSSDYVNIGSRSSLNLGAGNFTLCSWFKTTGSEEDIVANGVSTDGNYLLMSYLTKLRGHIWYGGNSNTIDSNAVVNNGSWRHGCQVVDSTKIYLYVDGSLDNSANLSGSKVGVTGTTVIGARSTSPGSYSFTGSLDEVRIYNRALSADEIKQLYLMGK